MNDRTTRAPMAGQPARPSRRTTMAIGFIIMLAILGGAWFVSGREGLSQLGRGGRNSGQLPKIGQPAPDFTALDLTDNKIVHLSDFKGHPIWLNFWGSWCPPCRAETPDLEAAYRDLQPKGLVLLAVSLDEAPETAWNYAQLNHVTYTVLTDPNREGTGAAYPIANFPTHILIDKQGIVRQIVIAPIDQSTIEDDAQTILAPTR